MNVVNAAVKFKRSNNLFAAFERSQILLVITDRFLQFGNLDVECIYHSRIVLRLQRKVGNLIVQPDDLCVKSVYRASVQFVGFLQLIIERLQIGDLRVKAFDLPCVLVLIRLQRKHLIIERGDLAV